MSEHKFVVGQSVQFSPDWLIDKTTEGQYTIVRLFPKVGNVPQYRIKSERDGHERMVLEDRLDQLAGPATSARDSQGRYFRSVVSAWGAQSS